MSQGDLADTKKATTNSSNSTNAIISPLRNNHKRSSSTNLPDNNNTQHVSSVATSPEISTTLKTGVMQLRSGYRSNDSEPKYFDPYDPWIGIRTAAILGGFLMIIVVYILYKARCRLGGSIEETKISYYQEYKDKRRERILMNIRAKNNVAQNDTTPQDGDCAAASLDLTAKWIQSQPLCSAIPDENNEMRTPILNRMQNRLSLNDVQLHASLTDLRILGGKEKNSALFQMLQESNQDHFPIDHRNFTAKGEHPICEGKVSNTNIAPSSDLTYLSGQSPPMSNTHFHKPLIHQISYSDHSIDENCNLPSNKLDTEAVQLEMVQLPNIDLDNSQKDSDSVELNSEKSEPSSAYRTTHDITLTNESKMRSFSHNSLIPSASSMSSGLDLINPARLTVNGGPKVHKKSRSNGNIVQTEFDVQYSNWKPPHETVTKL